MNEAKGRYSYIQSSLSRIMIELDRSGIMRSPQGCVFITSGNSFRSDDGVGPYIGSKLADGIAAAASASPQQTATALAAVTVINAGTVPENHIEEVIKLSPNHVIFIDAAQFGGKPGELILLDEKAGLPDHSLSTHTLPLNLIAALIKAECSASIYYIGIQAASLNFSEKLSRSVQKAADLLIAEITRNWTSISN